MRAFIYQENPNNKPNFSHRNNNVESQDSAQYHIHVMGFYCIIAVQLSQKYNDKNPLLFIERGCTKCPYMRYGW